MRGWWKAALIQDLITRFEAIPNKGTEDSASLELLQSHLKDEIQFPRFPQTKLLRGIGAGYYSLVLGYLKRQWAPTYTVIPDVSILCAENEISFSGDVESFSHVWVRRHRYGAAQEHRGQSAKYAYIDSRIPVEIERIFRVKHKVSQHTIVATFAIVRRFCSCEAAMDFPWDLRYISASYTYC
ncbi:hypothetical protein C8R45DRAFT_825736 [Mycena sanguinolenta]|nr:hypothetical protein C8R45DRAFT_825736 [Mycena sanguinolenta]